MHARFALALACGLLLLAPSLRADDDDSASDDDDSAESLPNDAGTYGWLCGVGAPSAVPAAPMLLLAGVGLLGRRTAQRP